MTTPIAPSTSATTPTAPKSHVWRTIGRFVLGLPLLVFGLNAFLNFIPQPKTPLAPAAAAFAGALASTGYMMPLIGITQLISGLLLVTNRFVPLALLLLAPFFVNSLAFHLCLEHTGLPMSAVFSALEVALLWSYRQAYAPVLRAKHTD